MKRKSTLFDRLTSIHVRDYYRWNRAKAIACCACLIGAIVCIGGLEGEGGMSNPKLAGLFILIGAYFAICIDTDWERKR